MSDISRQFVTSVPVLRYYRHKKTGKLYYVIDMGRDCTNSRDGVRVVIYRDPNDDTLPLFVREVNEFHERFALCAGERERY
jgi:hypothetical protein